ncbi:hypothetical protein NMY22_g2663 [Coprinellus aureogranulatus]|nr:hypothetical protein NMY22_g2663 [Coprinellus aureogranulatus]
MAFSKVGKKKLASHVIFLIFDLISLGLAVKVNKFHDFFYYADIFPLALSTVSLVLVFTMLALDVTLARSWTSFPPFEIIILGILSIFWLSFNAFSTSRWQGIPMNCNIIPPEFAPERVWCRDTNALKAFVWLTFLICSGITVWTTCYTVSQYKSGRKHVLSTPLSRYRPETNNLSHHRSVYSIASGFSDFFPVRFDRKDPFQRAPTPVEVIVTQQQASEKHEPYKHTFEQSW